MTVRLVAMDSAYRSVSIFDNGTWKYKEQRKKTKRSSLVYLIWKILYFIRKNEPRPVLEYKWNKSLGLGILPSSVGLGSMISELAIKKKVSVNSLGFVRILHELLELLVIQTTQKMISKKVLIC